MTTLRVHFDGRVLIPEGPVDDLPRDRSFEVVVREEQEPKPLPIRMDPATGLPYFEVPPGSKTITSEDVRRALDDE